MRPGRHAVDDGSFRRSSGVTAGIAAGRGAALLFVAVVLGIFLLNRTDSTKVTTVPQKSTPTTKHVTATTVAPSVVTTTTLAAHQPAQVKVLAANGTNLQGVGARAKDVLAQAGYNALAPIDAKTKGVKATVVYYAPTYDRDAVAITALFGIAPTAIQPLPNPATTLVADTRGANVVVLVGEDIATKLPAATTTTTAKAAATTTTTSKATTTTAKATTTTAKPTTTTAKP